MQEISLQEKSKPIEMRRVNETKDIQAIYDFNSLPDRLFCKLTKRLMQNPVVLSCSHWFNESDLKKYLEKVHPLQPYVFCPKSCPVCHKPINPLSIAPQNEIKKEISLLLKYPHPSLFLLRNHSFSFECLNHFETPSQSQKFSSSNYPDCSCLSDFVKDFADFSSRYGMAYRLYDGKTGAYFNDKTKITLSPCGSYVQYITCDSQIKYMAPKGNSQKNSKKLKLLCHFVSHFNSQNATEQMACSQRSLIFSPSISPNSPLLSEEEMVSNLERNNEIWSLFHLEKWHKKGNDYVFLLSQGGIQITFEDGGAIMFYRCNQTFSFLNPEKKLQTFNFSSISHHTNPEIANRLELAERLLLEFKVITIS